MKTLIAYSGKYGATAKAARELAKGFDQADVIDLDQAGELSLEGYDTVLLGSAVYAGQIRKSVRAFCKANESTLIYKRLALFLCCCTGEEQAQTVFRENFTPFLLSHALEKRVLGGEVQWDKMNFLEQKIMRAVMKKQKLEGDPAMMPERAARLAARMRL